MPEAVAFAFVAGVDPLVGLYAAFMVGLITSVFGGRPGMISGATGALAVVMVSLVAQGNEMGAPGENLGLYYLFATVILMGFIQVACRSFEIGKICETHTTPCHDGFCQWSRHRYFSVPTRNVQKKYWRRKSLASGIRTLSHGRSCRCHDAHDVGTAQIQADQKSTRSTLIGHLSAVSTIAILFKFDVATVGSFIRDGGGEGLKGAACRRLQWELVSEGSLSLGPR